MRATADAASSDTCSAVSYDVYRSDIPGEPGSVIASLPQATTSFTDTTAVAGQTYSYTVIARDTFGNEASTVTQRDVTTASEVPVFDGVRTVVLGERCDVAQLSWVAGRSMCQGRSLHYNVYRSATSGALGSLISEPKNRSPVSSGSYTTTSMPLDLIRFMTPWTLLLRKLSDPAFMMSRWMPTTRGSRATMSAAT